VHPVPIENAEIATSVILGGPDEHSQECPIDAATAGVWHGTGDQHWLRSTSPRQISSQVPSQNFNEKEAKAARRGDEQQRRDAACADPGAGRGQELDVTQPEAFDPVCPAIGGLEQPGCRSSGKKAGDRGLEIDWRHGQRNDDAADRQCQVGAVRASDARSSTKVKPALESELSFSEAIIAAPEQF
jgi:hypothetical protein